jgi:hypothetical protein
MNDTDTGKWEGLEADNEISFKISAHRNGSVFTHTLVERRIRRTPVN